MSNSVMLYCIIDVFQIGCSNIRYRKRNLKISGSIKSYSTLNKAQAGHRKHCTETAPGPQSHTLKVLGAK